MRMSLFTPRHEDLSGVPVDELIRFVDNPNAGAILPGSGRIRDTSVSYVVRSNPTLPTSVLDYLTNNTGHKHWWDVLENPGLSAERIEELYRNRLRTYKPNVSIDISVFTSRLINNPSTPTSVLADMYEKFIARKIPPAWGGRSYGESRELLLFTHQNCPETLLHENYHNWTKTIVKNPNLPLDLVVDAEPEHYESILENHKNLPESFMWKVLNFWESLESKDFSADLPNAIASSANVTPEIMEKLLDEYVSSYRGLAANPKTSLANLNRIFNTGFGKVGSAIQGLVHNPATDLVLLEEILKYVTENGNDWLHGVSYQTLFDEIAERLHSSFEPYNEWPLEWVIEYTKPGT